MAKCIKKNDRIIRVSNKEAAGKVANDNWKYVPTGDWKRQEDK